MKNLKYFFVLVLAVFFFGCSNSSSDEETGNNENIDFNITGSAIFLIPETENIESVVAYDVGICPSLYDNVYMIIKIRVLKDKKPTEFYIVDKNNNLKNNQFEETDLSQFNNINDKYFNSFKNNPDPEHYSYKYYIKKLSDFSLVNTILDENYDLRINYKGSDNKRVEERLFNLQIKYFPTETTWNDLMDENISEEFFPIYKYGNHCFNNPKTWVKASEVEEENRYITILINNEEYTYDPDLWELHRNNLDDYVFKPGKKE